MHVCLKPPEIYLPLVALLALALVIRSYFRGPNQKSVQAENSRGCPGKHNQLIIDKKRLPLFTIPFLIIFRGSRKYAAHG